MVGAFRAAVELDLKRRENDKKVSLVFAAMRDMMAVLAQYVAHEAPIVLMYSHSASLSQAEGYQRTQT